MEDNLSIMKILLIEDNPGDVRLVKEMLAEENAGFELTHAERLEEGVQYLKKNGYDVVLLDLNLPDSEGFGTFTELHAQNPEKPIIILTGMDDKELGLDSVKKGAQDYLVKGKFDSLLLMRSIVYSIERQKLLLQLETAMKELKVLKGMLPICSSCKKIRDDKGYWNQLEFYISEHTDAEFTHGLCPECAEKYMEEYRKMKNGKGSKEANDER
jgi:DNA-binding response OmpR family regulator